MAQWAAFAGLTGAVLAFLLGLARLSQGYVTDPPAPPEGGPADADGGPDGHTRAANEADGGEHSPAPGASVGSAGEPAGAAERTGRAASDPAERTGSPSDPAEPAGSASDPAASTGSQLDPAASTGSPGRTDAVEMSPGVLLANVALSQGLLFTLLAFGALFFRIPAQALGLADLSGGVWVAGVGLGAALYVANEAGAAAADRLGMGHDERLRELLAPDSPRGWVLLLCGALPVIAGFEELLFRAALVGAIPAGFGVSPWAMAVLSSVAFGLGHGAQGRSGIAVTASLGLVLAAAFVLTGSLVVVFVAHYLVNALEFLVHEGLGIEWVE